ncbi:MAG: hypothetical protein K2P84_08180 [Undibacterium sp.]|nr:hypothetical protein [Undibacterium sp.]
MDMIGLILIVAFILGLFWWEFDPFGWDKAIDERAAERIKEQASQRLDEMIKIVAERKAAQVNKSN